jgi:DNA excision repair protein ERCC-4
LFTVQTLNICFYLYINLGRYDAILLVDDREPKSCIDNGINKFGSENIEVTRLKTGDLLYDGVTIERKEIADLISSVVDGRLHEQAQKMMIYPQRFLVIEGNFDNLRSSHERYRKYHNKWFYGVLASLTVKYGLQVVQVKDNIEFWTLIERIIYKVNERKDIENSRIFNPKLSKRHKKNVALSMLCCIPTISENKGLRILEHYNLRELYDIGVEELQEINGVGPALAERIKSEFNEGL